jgi:thiosulfate dehydrogenase [quinone] large subunit
MQTSSDKPETDGGGCGGACGGDYTLAFLVLRAWLGVRALLTGIEKYASFRIVQKPLLDPLTGQQDASGALVEVKEKYYALTNYSGIPAPMKDTFANEPLLPKFALHQFDVVLGPFLILTGIMLLVGFGTRLSLFLQGLLYTALMSGLLLIRQDDGISWLGIHVGLVALALMLAKHNRLCLSKKW